METTITIDKKYIKQSFGSTDLMVDYYFTTVDGIYKNTYLVKCRINALEMAEPYLYPVSAELVEYQETNQYTLVEDAVIDLFNEEIL